MGRKVWKNEEARTRLESWYAKFQSRIAEPVESQTVKTSIGASHLLTAGPKEAPPLVCLHAMRTGSAHLLSELGPLLGRFRVIAPDLPGQSVRGPQVRLPLNDDSHARWLCEILDGLGIAEADFFGVSWGGYVALSAASHKPERIKRLALLVPAGIVNGSHWKGLTRMALPMMRYRMTGSERHLRKFLDPIMTTWDADWAGYMGESLRDMPLDPRIPPLATDLQLKNLKMPVLTIGGSDDISFPGREMTVRALNLISHGEVELLSDCRHCPPTTPEFRAWLSERLSAFFGV